MNKKGSKLLAFVCTLKQKYISLLLVGSQEHPTDRLRGIFEHGNFFKRMRRGLEIKISIHYEIFFDKALKWAKMKYNGLPYIWKTFCV